ncbi:MAG: hypothetical protein ACREE2_13620 [Stellaceae bacterium]
MTDVVLLLGRDALLSALRRMIAAAASPAADPPSPLIRQLRFQAAAIARAEREPLAHSWPPIPAPG